MLELPARFKEGRVGTVGGGATKMLGTSAVVGPECKRDVSRR